MVILHLSENCPIIKLLNNSNALFYFIVFTFSPFFVSYCFFISLSMLIKKWQIFSPFCFSSSILNFLGVPTIILSVGVLLPTLKSFTTLIGLHSCQEMSSKKLTVCNIKRELQHIINRSHHIARNMLKNRNVK